jgi:hypothetical protein
VGVTDSKVGWPALEPASTATTMRPMEAALNFSSYMAASKALQKMSTQKPEELRQFIVRIERSPYAGWCINRYPVDQYVELLSDGQVGKSTDW